MPADLVARFIDLISGQLERFAVTPLTDLIPAITRQVDTRNTASKPLVWTTSVQNILGTS